MLFHKATRSGSIHIIKYLIENEAEINAQDRPFPERETEPTSHAGEDFQPGQTTDDSETVRQFPDDFMKEDQ